MTPAEIAGLAERCERATPADLSDLGLALRLAFPDATLDTLTSLDAALAFVCRLIPNARWAVGYRWDGGSFASVGGPEDSPIRDTMSDVWPPVTAPMALVAAALRALAARDGGGA